MLVFLLQLNRLWCAILKSILRNFRTCRVNWRVWLFAAVLLCVPGLRREPLSLGTCKVSWRALVAVHGAVCSVVWISHLLLFKLELRFWPLFASYSSWYFNAAGSTQPQLETFHSKILSHAAQERSGGHDTPCWNSCNVRACYQSVP